MEKFIQSLLFLKSSLQATKKHMHSYMCVYLYTWFHTIPIYIGNIISSFGVLDTMLLTL